MKLSMSVSIHTSLHIATNGPTAVLRCAEENNDYGGRNGEKILIPRIARYKVQHIPTRSLGITQHKNNCSDHSCKLHIHTCSTNLDKNLPV
jgi:hypothetical protein